jgi:hypothetical protein
MLRLRPQSTRVPVIALSSWLALPSLASAETLVRIDDYVLDDLRVSGFEIPRKAHLQVEAVGARPRWASDYSAYAWILNSATREIVWSQEHAGSQKMDEDRLLRRSREEIDLEPGRYELGRFGLDHPRHVQLRGRRRLGRHRAPRLERQPE